VNQRATEIRFKELTLFTSNLGVIASLAAFFAETSLDSLYIEPETVAKKHTHNRFSTLCWALSAVTISLNLLTLLVAMYTMLHGPALAIRGPAGSMSVAVSRIFVQRRLALRLFWAGLLCKVVQATCLAGWRYPPEIASAVAAVFGVFMLATYRCIHRVTTKFSFKQFGIRRADFIEISVPTQTQRSPFAGGQPSENSAYSGQPFDDASGPTSGWMMKQSAYLKNWSSRYFTISGGRLAWAAGENSAPRGYIRLAAGDVRALPVQISRPGVFNYGLEISCRDPLAKTVTEIVVATESPEARDRWCRALLYESGRPSLGHDEEPLLTNALRASLHANPLRASEALDATAPFATVVQPPNGPSPNRGGSPNCFL